MQKGKKIQAEQGDSVLPIQLLLDISVEITWNIVRKICWLGHVDDDDDDDENGDEDENEDEDKYESHEHDVDDDDDDDDGGDDDDDDDDADIYYQAHLYSELKTNP